ncbi:EEF1A lysine methyltransferase 4 isoform X2 [Vigna unguiculata]|uniref:EEF1A lysine methyltransferase 4 isoform X2 n=1 Tax=Vigna unguiculata TaxID=3917 RepID=UPI001016C836|nr:EEF1A lysine methyltransferase 4 isoform X2 [Vigna unguiculata]
MYRDVSSCNTYNYGDALYWDARYVQEGGSFDWYQRYSALRPFVRNFIPLSSRILMVGCGNADLQMDVRDMSLFPDESFDGVIDKGTLDSLMCGTDAPISASQMLAEVCRLLKPGGTYILITYGDPTVRMPHLSRPVYNWKITLYNIPRPGFQKAESSTPSRKSFLEPIPLSEKGLLPADFVLEDPDSHFIYVCKKINDTEIDTIPTYQLTADVL